jgi:tetratricopeptide (TPR) repeat protein
VLFDLRGKRKRAVQVVYVMLAVIFLLGFVGFGIGVGGGGPGGIFDALGIGGGGSSSTSSAFADQVAAAEARAKRHPQDEHALYNLARYEFLSGQSQLGPADQATGQPQVTDASVEQFNKAVDAWERYVKVAKKPDSALAGQIAFAYSAIGDFGGAARAQRINAGARPSANAYYQLAIYEYENLDLKAGDAAGDKVVALSTGAQKQSARKQMDQLAKVARKYVKAQKAATPSGGSSSGGTSQNPFGGLTPTTTTPAP